MFRHLLSPVRMFRRTRPRKASPSRPVRSRHPLLQVEMLESRLVPSTVGLVGGNLEVDCNGSGNVVAVDDGFYLSGFRIIHYTQVYLNGTTTDWTDTDFSKIQIYTLKSGSDDINLQGSVKEVDMYLGPNDSVRIGDLYQDLSRITGSVIVSASSNGSSLTVLDGNNSQTQSWQLNSDYISRSGAGTIYYYGINYLDVYGSGGSSVYDVLETYDHLTALVAPSASDTVNVSATTGTLDVTTEPHSTLLQLGGSLVNVGDGFNVNNIRGPVYVFPSGSRPTTVNINDQYDTNQESPTIDTYTPSAGLVYTRVTGLAQAPIYCDSATCWNVNINTGSGTTVVGVLSTAPLGPNGQGVLTVAGNSETYVSVGSNSSVQNIRGTLRITNGHIYNGIYVNDSADPAARTVDLQSVIIGNDLFGEIDGLAPAPIQYQYNETNFLNLDSGPGDYIDVEGAGTTTYLNPDGANTAIFVGGDQGVQSIESPLLIGSNAISGNISVDIGDVPDSQSRTVTLSTYVNSIEYDEVAGLTPQPITIEADNLAGLAIEGGSGGDTFEVQNTSTSDSFPTTIYTNFGGNTVNVHATSTSPLSVYLSGNDTVNIGDAVNGLAYIGTPVTVVGNGIGQGDTIDVLDQANPNPETYVVTNITLVTSTSQIVNYQDFDTLVLYPSPDPATTVVDGHDPDLFTLVTNYAPPPPGGGGGDGASVRQGPGLAGQILPVNDVVVPLTETTEKGGLALEGVAPASDAMLRDVLSRAAKIARGQQTAVLDLAWIDAAMTGMPAAIAR